MLQAAGDASTPDPPGTSCSLAVFAVSRSLTLSAVVLFPQPCRRTGEQGMGNSPLLECVNSPFGCPPAPSGELNLASRVKILLESVGSRYGF